jgi:hypothetical protein
MLEPRTDGETIWLGNRFSFTLQRTLRIPDDDRTYPLPPGLGTFPVYHVADYRDRLPEDWVRHGGVFIPMYQSEALWICFNGSELRPHAVKVAVGKVNAVSGKPWNQSLEKGLDDYLVSPPQPWLDGINAGDGFIRQFVAMPLGMGYTVEGQVTGEERYGGLQIIAYAPKPGLFEKKETDRLVEGAGGFEGEVMYELCEDIQPVACKTMGIAAGGRMKQVILPDPHGIGTWDGENYGRLFIHILNSEMFREVTGEAPPPTPVSARTYTEHGFPWFKLYDEGMGDIEAPEELAKVKSVVELDQEKGLAGKDPEGPLDIPEDNIVGLRFESRRVIETGKD